MVVVTGAGRGIGFEAARSLLWLGAKVVVAEVNETDGSAAAQKLSKEFGEGRCIFVKTDVGEEEEIRRLAEWVQAKLGRVDVVLNNATVFPLGAVENTSVERWDLSYRVNLRGPVLLARTFLPGMLQRKHGVFVCVSSSGAAPFMGPYEVFKTAQGELANTIAAEAEGQGVYAYTIGPGIVRTPGFEQGGAQVASLMGKTLDELLDMNRNFVISPEAAGTGFAASIALASKYHGQETSSIQVLREIGIVVGEESTGESEEVASKTTPEVTASVTRDELYSEVMRTYSEQSDGWKKRNLFERQWVARDFKKNIGMSIEEMLTSLKEIGRTLNDRAGSRNSAEILNKLAAYDRHQQDQLKGFEKDPKKLQENLAVIDGWVATIKLLLERQVN